MNKTNKRFLVFAFMVIVVLFLYFNGGEIMNSSMNGNMNENGWLGVNSWWWFSTAVILIWGVSFGWLFYRKRY
jgi:hypothetical protein